MNLSLLKSHFHWQSVYLRYAIRLTIACFLAVLLYTLLALHNGYWLAFSVLACVWPTTGISLQRIRQRMIGTFLGMWLGILIAHFFIGQYWLIELVLPLFIFLMFYLKAYDYSLFVLFTTVVTMLFVCLLDPGDWHMAITRLELTLGGVLIAFFSTLFILPVHESRQLPRRLKTLKASLKEYFIILTQHYQGELSQHLPIIQAQTFKHLQTTLETVNESRFEWGHGRHDQQRIQASKRLGSWYEKMLCLDIHMPRDFSCPDLQRIEAPLGDVMQAMVPLFDQPDTAKVFSLNTQLAELQAKIKSRRSSAAQDPSLKAAIFHEYIQLSLFIETLQKLLVDL